MNQTQEKVVPFWIPRRHSTFRSLPPLREMVSESDSPNNELSSYEHSDHSPFLSEKSYSFLNSRIESYGDCIKKITDCQQENMKSIPVDNTLIFKQIDKYKTDHGIKTDTDMVPILKMSKQAISAYRNNRKQIARPLARKVALRLGLEEDFFEQQQPRMKENTEVEFYQRQIESLTETIDRLLTIIEQMQAPLAHRAENNLHSLKKNGTE